MTYTREEAVRPHKHVIMIGTAQTGPIVKQMDIVMNYQDVLVAGRITTAAPDSTAISMDIVMKMFCAGQITTVRRDITVHRTEHVMKMSA